MARHRVRKRHRIGIKLIALALLLIGILILVDIRVRPIIEKTTIYQGKILATRIINDSVYSELAKEDFSYNELVSLSYDDSGAITSIESNMLKINLLKAKITKSINEQLEHLDDQDLSISLGTLSGFSSFYNQGLLIPVTVRSEGYVEASLISAFENAGINQTLHRILLEISVDISAVIPGYTASATVKTEFVVAETVIVGVVPDGYTHVITGGEDLMGILNDYETR